MTDGLCEPCEAWIMRYISDHFKVDGQDDIRPVDDGVGNNLLGGLRRIWPGRGDPNFMGTRYQWRPASIGSCYICYHLSLDSLIKSRENPERGCTLRASPTLTNEIEVLERDATVASFTFKSEIYEGRELPKKMWSLETASHARTWLYECLGNSGHEHWRCEGEINPNQAKFLPSRLIHVTGDGNVLRATLRETKELINPSEIRYISVSHRWGTEKFLTLTPENYSGFKVTIPLYDPQFSKKFVDIFQVVVDLGYHYIWIDSLCIIQGDYGEKDWAEQCPLMAYIYRDADCNIAVAGSTSSGGLFGAKKNSVEIFPPKVKFPTGRRFYLVHENHFDNQIEFSPLFNRGWVVQERLLSRRILYFTDNNIIWQCLKGYASATYCWNIATNESASVYKKEDMYTRRTLRNQIIRDHSSINGARDLLDIWYRGIVSRYSGTDLTKSRDRLPALSGIAAVVHKLIGSRYFAGHWELDLLSSLYWYSDSSFPSDPGEELAPSWSWASTPVQKEFGYEKFCSGREISRLITAETERTTSDVFGSVQSGFIIIEGPLMKLEPDRLIQDASGEFLPLYESFFNIFSYFDLEFDDWSDYGTDYRCCRGKRSVGADQARNNKSMPFFLLPLTPRSSFVYVQGIVLSPAADKPWTYRRVGCFYFSQFLEKRGETSGELLEQGRAHLTYKIDEIGTVIEAPGWAVEKEFKKLERKTITII
ncbi:heterokaryon incompatibility protein-domain-containing protein [Xylaria digitata]|nr:heterokaryon incompatibility protein-domain-containing protein [Xylaria digitata]